MNFDIIIAGGGVPGLCLAALLGRAGFSVALIDAEAPTPPLAKLKPDGRTVALMTPSISTLMQASVWPALQPYATPLDGLRIIDDSDYPRGSDAMVEVNFKPTDIGANRFGWSVPIMAARAALCAQIKTLPNITHLTNMKVARWHNTPAHALVTLSNSKHISAALVIGADGRESVVRTQAGINATRKPYGQTALTCLVAHSLPHHNISTEFHRTGGPFTLVPAAGQTSAIVWVERTADTHALLTLKKEAFVKALSTRTRGLLGTITLLETPAPWPIETLHATQLTSARCALMAEAAHVLSPIGAQGMNLSLRDAQTLADLLIKGRSLGLKPDATSTLAAYEKTRSADMGLRLFAVDALNRAVMQSHPAWRGVRRLGLRLLQHPSPVRSFLMRQGLAPEKRA